MTLYIVRHDDGDVRLYDDDGTLLFDAPDDIRDTESLERGLVEAFVDANPGADLLGDSVRPYFVDLLAANFRYRDLGIEGETVPWE